MLSLIANSPTPMNQPSTIPNLSLVTEEAPVTLPPAIRLHEPEGQAGRATKRILLLEDDAAFGEIMTDFLRESGIRIEF